MLHSLPGLWLLQTLVACILTLCGCDVVVHRCGAYARALQYFETFVRQQHGGGLNPAAYGGGCSRCGLLTDPCSVSLLDRVQHQSYIHNLQRNCQKVQAVLGYSCDELPLGQNCMLRLTGPARSCFACSYDYDEVSFLLEVYGHLEEPDGIAGQLALLLCAVGQ